MNMRKNLPYASGGVPLGLFLGRLSGTMHEVLALPADFSIERR
jgi:hypothetical protein